MLNLVIKINLLNLKGVNDKKTFGVRIDSVRLCETQIRMNPLINYR